MTASAPGPADAPSTTGSANWSSLVRAAAAAHADRPALAAPDRSATWSELDRAADAAAADLLESGARRGDRVVLALPSGADLVLALVAVARAGLVAVPVDPRRADLAVVADRVSARVQLSLGPAAAARGVEIAPGTDDVAGWWRADRGPVAPIGGGEDLAVLARASRSYRAVMIPHRAVLAAVEAITTAPHVGLTDRDRVVMALPVHHLAGLVTAFLPLAPAGACAVFPGDDPASGRLDGLPALVREERVSVIPGSPGVYRALLAAPGAERALASVRLMTSGAAPLEPADAAAVRALTGQRVWEGYGISESTAVVASSLLTPQSRPGSVGRAMGQVRLRIEARTGAEDGELPVPDAAPAAVAGPADVEGEGAPGTPDAVGAADDAVAGPADTADGRSPDRARLDAARLDAALVEVAGIGEVGRICLSGPTLFSGYWPDGADGPDADGWFRTEDVGYLDDLGELHLVDRADETFTVAGFTVYPREVEQALTAHPAVAAAVVGAVPGSGATPGRVVAVLQLVPGAERPSDAELAEHLEGRLAPFKHPAAYAVVDAIPVTELGRQHRGAALDLAGFAVAARPVAAWPPRPAPAPADAPDGTGPAAGADPVDPEAPTPERTPERAAGLDDLGGRLPGTGNRRARSLDDSDDDLFGDDWS